jgi:hypothetical protein
VGFLDISGASDPKMGTSERIGYNNNNNNSKNNKNKKEERNDV